MVSKKGLQEFDRKAESINEAVLEVKKKQEGLAQEVQNPKQQIKNAKINF